MFCPKCKSMLVLNRNTGQRECKRPNCGHSESKGETKITSREMEKKRNSSNRGTRRYFTNC